MSFLTEAQKALQRQEEQCLLRTRKELYGPQGPNVQIDNKNIINFSSNDYLGLANSYKLKEWLKAAIDEYGTGSGSSQLVSGYSCAHKQLENKVASFLHRDRALLFSSGYLANLSLASALVDRTTLILQDKINHASLIDAALLSPGRLMRYRHNDMTQLEDLLIKNKTKKAIVMTDAVFSMDGDFAKLESMADLCLHYDALLLVDDAHGIGVLGDEGGGLLSLLNLGQEQVPLMTGTFGKSFGMSGAFIAGNETLIEMILQKARTYIYTTGMPPANAATLVKVIDHVHDAVDLRKALKSNIDLFCSAIKKKTGSGSHIQPVIIGENEKTMRVSQSLFEKGLLASAIRPPTVPEGSARLRISLSAAHTVEQVTNLAGELNRQTG